MCLGTLGTIPARKNWLRVLASDWMIRPQAGKLPAGIPVISWSVRKPGSKGSGFCSCTLARIPELKPRVSLLNPASRLARRIDSDSWRAGKTTAERGYGGRWQAARKRFLSANPLCAMCQAQGYLAAASLVDHRQPHRGDPLLFWDESNWQSLCERCHNSTKKVIENAEKSQR